MCDKVLQDRSGRIDSSEGSDVMEGGMVGQHRGIWTSQEILVERLER